MPGKSRRPKGEGSIVRTRTGKWRATITINGHKIVGPSVTKKADALPALKSKLAQPLSSSITLLTCLIDWINKAERLGTNTQTTIALKRGLLQTHIAPHAHIPLEAATQSWLDQLLANIPSQATRRNVGSLIAVALKSHGVHLAYPMKQLRRKNTVVLDDDGRRDLLMACDSEQETLMVEILSHVGLRRGELLALRHEDVYQQGIYVINQVVKVPGTTFLKAPKTPQSAAWVPLPHFLMARVGHGRTGFLFPSPTDPSRPKSPGWPNEALTRISARAGLPTVKPHDLRRTAIMWLMSQPGVEVATVASITRHDVMTLLKIYSESRTDLKLNAMNMIAPPDSSTA